ncbi:MAG: heparinase II/III family protein [Cyclobacteriaceae bacterium]|nr:heparinase II/III family protein [Cyclobacteriaceae bacterium]
MISPTLKLSVGLLIFLTVLSCNPDENNGPGGAPFNGVSHPRILLLEGEEEGIKNNIATNATWKKMHYAIMKKSNALLGEPLLERIQTGRRLLSISRECLKRVFYLSYSYRITGDEKYALRAEKEMVNVSQFSDWNPSHFLDVAEMTMAVAIGYDWLYDMLSEESREIIRAAILEGINLSYNSDYNWFLKATHNWNQVCNAGIVYGALAIAEHYPDLAQKTIDRALETVPLAMHDYQPQGAYPEGYAYWGYGTTFNVMLLSALEKAMIDDNGLTESPGFLETAGFLENMTGTTSNSYNWGDCGSTTGSLNPAMFWLAKQNNDPSLLWVEKGYLEEPDYSRFTGNRLLPAIMIWGKDIPLEAIAEPTAKVWMGQGANPVYLARTSWNDPNGIYLGFKAGSASVNHGHMDIGSFIMESDGVRWAMDFGSQDYYSLESKGIKLFGTTQDAQRWTVFRLNNYVHNTLTVDGMLQQVKGYAKIDKNSDNENFSYALSDLSTVYDGELSSITRGVGIVESSYVVVRDELVTLDKNSSVRWVMLTPAEVTLNGDNTATLTKDGKTLQLQVQSPANVTLQTWSTQPTTDYDAPNPGTILVGFELDVAANTDQVIQVALVPEKAIGKVEFLGKSLAEW